MLAERDIDSVLEDLDALDVEAGPNVWSRWIELRVTALQKAGRGEEARSWLAQRLERDPQLATHPAAYQTRAELALIAGDVAAGFELMRLACEGPRDAGDARALVAIMVCALALNRWSDVLAAYALLTAAHADAARAGDVRVMAAFAYLRNGRYQQALERLEGAEPSRSMLVMRDLTGAEAELRLERPDRALALLAGALEPARVVTTRPEYVVMLHTLRAQAFNARKEFEAAQSAASTAIALATRRQPPPQLRPAPRPRRDT